MIDKFLSRHMGLVLTVIVILPAALATLMGAML
jgi:hypothetical protein